MKIASSMLAVIAVLIQMHEHLRTEACPYLRTQDLSSKDSAVENTGNFVVETRFFLM